MLSRVADLLEPGEEVHETVNPSVFDRRFLVPYLAAFAIFASILVVMAGFDSVEGVFPIRPLGVAPLLVVPVLIAVVAEVKRRFIMYHFTDRKLIVERGILRKDFVTVRYDRVTDTRTEQTLLDRVLRTGDIEISTAGSDAFEARIRGIRNPSIYKVGIDSEGRVAMDVSDVGDIVLRDGSEELEVVEESLPRRVIASRLSRVEVEKDELESAREEDELEDKEFQEQMAELRGRERELLDLLELLEEDES
ncbi:MAG: PH domain-containing protein [Candidatus Nanohaloarchaea archaeon]|nr:PH domain-containing protein [Candidatus Nanohaloarchaea archaeon]